MKEGFVASKKGDYNKKRAFLIIAGTTITVCGFLGLILFLPSGSKGVPNQLAKAQNAVDFPIYYPTELPIGFSFDKDISNTSQVVFYSYTYDKTKKLSLSVQPLTDDVNTDSFNPTSEFTTHIGRAYVVDLENRTSAAIVGDKSWVLINAPNKIALSTLQQFLDSLRPVNR